MIRDTTLPIRLPDEPEGETWGATTAPGRKLTLNGGEIMTTYTKTELNKIAHEAIRDSNKKMPSPVRAKFKRWEILASQQNLTLRVFYSWTNPVNEIKEGFLNVAI